MCEFLFFYFIIFSDNSVEFIFHFFNNQQYSSIDTSSLFVVDRTMQDIVSLTPRH